MTMYMCDPDKNVGCRKTGCLFYLGGECFSTLNEEFAVRNDGKPVSFPEDKYDTMLEKAIDERYRRLIGKKVKA